MISLAFKSIWRGVNVTRGHNRPHSNWPIFRHLSTAANLTKKDEEISQTTLDVIKKSVSSRERISYSTFNEYVESLNEPVTTVDISFLYECIARYLPQVQPDRKAELIAKLWTKVKQWKSPSQDDIISWLRALRECGADVVWSDLEHELENVEATLKVYEELLYLVSSFGQSEVTVEILDQIKQEEFPLTEKIFNALIVAHSRDRNIESVESVLELMSAASLTPNAETQFEVARAYINNDFWENSKEILDLAEFSPWQLIELIRCSLAAEGASDEFLALLVQKLPSDVLKNREIAPIVKNLLIELIHIQNKPADLLRLLKCLPKPTNSNTPSTENDDVYGAFLLYELLETNQPFSVINSICGFLVEDNRNPRAAHVVTEMCLRRRSSKSLSLDLLRYLATKEPLKPHYFWPLFIDEFQVNGEQGILNVIVEMKSLNVPVDEETIGKYVLPRLELTLNEVKRGIQLLLDAGLKMSEMSSSLLLRLLNTERYEDFQVVLKTYPSKVDGNQFLVPLTRSVAQQNDYRPILRVLKSIREHTKLPPNSDINGSFLLELCNMGKFVPLQGVVEDMFELKIKISSTAKSRIEDRLKMAKSLPQEQKSELLAASTKLMTNESTPLTGPGYLESKHPKDMSFEELESHLAELTEKQMNPRGVLRKMLQLAVKDERHFGRALELKAKCDELKMDYSPGMVASCIELYTRLEKFDLAKESWTELEKKFPNFVIDEHKAIDYATGLIKQNLIDEAKEILQKRATKKIYGENNNKNVWNLLTTLGEKGQNTAEHQTKSFLNFLVKHRYCSHTNTVLGPLVRDWLLKKDLRKAIDEYKDIVKKYRKTPLNLELLTILVEVKNGARKEFGEFTETEVMQLMNDVFKAVEQVHGVGAAKTSLLFATAEGGTDKQVRKILMDPSIRIDQQALQRQCEYLGRAGKTEPLFRLIKSSRGLSHNIINEQQLWSALLQTLAKQNQIEEAVRLFNRLLEEDEFKVSKEIAEIVIDLLKRNNLELPTRLKTFAG